MVFEDRVGGNEYRKKIKIISQTPTEIIADIERADGTEGGTQICAQTFITFQSNIEEAITKSDSAVNTANAAVGTANNANEKSDNAIIIANGATVKSDTAITDSAYAKNRANEVYAALADRGANVYVGGVAQTTVSFVSDPQSQINSLTSGKLNNSDKAANSALLDGKIESQLNVNNAINSTYCSSSVNLTGNQTISGEKIFQNKITCTEINLLI